MLQHNQSFASEGEPENLGDLRPEAEQTGATSGVERRRHPRVSLDGSSQEAEQTGSPTVDRRKYDRRGVDALRAELQWTYAPEAEKRGFGGMRLGFPGRLKPSRILLLLVALLAGGMAAYLAMQGDRTVAQPAATEQVAEVVKEARTKILVAKQPIGIGQRLSSTSIAWEDWPEGSVLSDYVTIGDAPGAISDMAGSVARFEFFPGDPIREQKLVQASQGYLSAVLDRGMRGVSVSVSAESASGGFINPNDHVDVVATRTSDTGQVSETILHNVRVLAINSRLGETGTTGAPEDPNNPRAEIFTKEAIATLALDPTQAEVIISAATAGKLSLVLLSIADFAAYENVDQRPTNAAIRISSPFWSE